MVEVLISVGFLDVLEHLVFGNFIKIWELFLVFFFHFDGFAFGGFLSFSSSRVLCVRVEAHLDVGFFGFSREGHLAVTSGGGRAAGGRDTRNLTRASFRAKIAAERVRKGGEGREGERGGGGRRSSSE